MVPSLSKDVSSLRLAIPEDAWCHLVYLIITLPALLYNAALSLLRHSKCLAGLFSETIMKLCAKTLQTVPPLPSLQPCVQEPEKKIPSLGRLLLSQRENTQNILQPSATTHLSQILLMFVVYDILYTTAIAKSMQWTHTYDFTSCRFSCCVCNWVWDSTDVKRLFSVSLQNTFYLHNINFSMQL